MALMQVAREAEGEHGQEMHNTSYASKVGMISEASSNQARNDDQDTKAPMQEVWSKWVEMQQQLMAAVKGAQSVPKKSSNRVPTWVRGGTVQVLVPVVRGLSSQATVKIMILPKTTEPRPEGE